MSKNNKKVSHNFQSPKKNQTINTSSTINLNPNLSLSERSNEVMTFDPRTLGTPVYNHMSELKKDTTDPAKLKKQKSMAQELYTYLSTWGLMRLKAEEIILKDGREDPVKKFFECLEEISGQPDLTLNSLKKLDPDEYLGLTGLGLEIAREFSFWVSAIYHDVSGENG